MSGFEEIHFVHSPFANSNNTFIFKKVSIIIRYMMANYSPSFFIYVPLKTKNWSILPFRHSKLQLASPNVKKFIHCLLPPPESHTFWMSFLSVFTWVMSLWKLIISAVFYLYILAWDTASMGNLCPMETFIIIVYVLVFIALSSHVYPPHIPSFTKNEKKILFKFKDNASKKLITKNEFKQSHLCLHLK